MSQLPDLVCLPPAGAGPSIFRDWQRSDPTVRAPSIPGREGRFREASAVDLRRLADRIAVEIAPKLRLRYGLFGYSMGGTVALLLAERLAAMGRPGPEVLFVLGALSPDRLHQGTERLHLLGSDDFWDEIARIGGTPDEILRDPDMRALFEPALRDDFRLCDGYRHVGPGYRLSCPVHVFVAKNDHLVGEDSATDWARHTTGRTELHVIDGDHMLDARSFAALNPTLRELWPGLVW
ncbi:thioesterase [Paracoccus caeni]|uniref:Thioesterase n=1 Tax=Paracoccus caeni TaxID=657651 RepID=A0A934VZM4_9RHOB|nr:thioesterase [Paracoccus caeni]MBK4215985.1 thioesterase [Paracoccus caeni]